MAGVLEAMGTEARERYEACCRIIRELGSVVVPFSAGVDSTLLVALAREVLGREKVLAAIGVSASLPKRERLAARNLAARIDVELVEVLTSEMQDPDYVANPPDRCYFCKRGLFLRLRDLAAARGFAVLASGANADDTGDFRPGLRACAELGVRSPLLEAGLTKADIRAASHAMGLPTWDKPARACLASRVPYGEAITPATVFRIEQAEYVLQDLGFAQCRVRDHGVVARIEVPEAALDRAVIHRDAITRALRGLGYTYVALDLAGFRSGSMNQVLRGQPTNQGGEP
jgi:pyridinium-3,5-biscarboxylic acid mononucleotide sulfurtransferase